MTNVIDPNAPHLKREERIQGGTGGMQDPNPAVFRWLHIMS